MRQWRKCGKTGWRNRDNSETQLEKIPSLYHSCLIPWWWSEWVMNAGNGLLHVSLFNLADSLRLTSYNAWCLNHRIIIHFQFVLWRELAHCLFHCIPILKLFCSLIITATNCTNEMMKQLWKKRTACQRDLNHHLVRRIRSWLQKDAIHCKQHHPDFLWWPYRKLLRKKNSILRITMGRDSHIFQSVHWYIGLVWIDAVHFVSLQLLCGQFLDRGLEWDNNTPILIGIDLHAMRWSHAHTFWRFRMVQRPHRRAFCLS